MEIPATIEFRNKMVRLVQMVKKIWKHAFSKLVEKLNLLIYIQTIDIMKIEDYFKVQIKNRKRIE